MRGRSHSIVAFVITIVHQREIWPGTFHQFMRARNHSSVLFVIETYQPSRAWLSTKHQFTRARNHLKVFHYSSSQKGDLTKHILVIHWGKKCSVCHNHFSTKQSLKIQNDSVHEDKESFKCSICHNKFSTKHS